MVTKKKKLVGMLLHAVYLRDARVQRQADCLAAKGFEVHVICARDVDRSDGSRETSCETVNGVHIHRVPVGKKRGSKIRYLYEYITFMLFGMFKLTFLHLRKRFDLVHIHNMPDFLVIAGLILRWTGASLILDVHDPMSEMFEATYHLSKSHPMIRALKLQERVSYNLAQYLLTVSTPMAENIAAKCRRPKEDIKVVHNFPSLTRFPIRQRKETWPYTRNNLVLLYSGTVTENYRLDIAVKAVALASKTLPNIKLHILGDGNRLHQVLALAKQLCIADKVQRLEPVPQVRVKDIMARADVGITTHQGGAFGDLYFSTKIIEFMTQGLPVISSKTATIKKYIPEDSIFYFEPLQVEDLVDQIFLMYNNPHLVQQKIINSRKILSNYNWNQEQNKFLDLYKKIIPNSYS